MPPFETECGGHSTRKTQNPADNCFRLLHLLKAFMFKLEVIVTTFRKLFCMKLPSQILLVITLVFGTVVSGYATVLVNDTWQDGDRTNPASPIYSENGTDADSDGDLESAWYCSSGAAMTTTPGHLFTALGTSSLSWTTYFTPEANPVTLVNAGEALQITWVFTPTTVGSGTSQNFRLAVVDTPSAARLTGNSSPGSAAYTGYAMFMNMATTLGGGTPFLLLERTAPGTSSAILSSSNPSVWTPLANGATSGNTGYASGTQYTFVMTLTRNATNGLDIVATMTGGSLNNTGSASVSFTDGTPNSFTYDTFGVRPSSASDSAAQFDTTLFKVEFISAATAPSITIDPQDQTALTGGNAAFNVLVAGNTPLSYQWYFNTNTSVNNATNSTLTLTNVQLTDAGDYFVVVTNSYGLATSGVATLTVNVPTGPSIVTQPQDQIVLPGQTAVFTVSAGGSRPLFYQWYFNTNTLLTNVTDDTLTITNVQAANAGVYSVVVSNLVNSVVSSNAILSLNTNPVAPFFTSQPVSLVVLIGGIASFTPVVSGTAPISYQWSKNDVPISGATSATLVLTNVQSTNSGSYTLTASNNVGSVTSDAAVLAVTTTMPVVNSAYDLVGFAQTTTGGGVIPESDTAYKKVFTALDLANAILSANETAGAVKVIEIMNDLDLGWNEVGAAVQTLGSTPFRAHATPKLHPRLLTTGVSLIDIKSKSGLTIFSANGATIRHACFNVKSTANIIIRNLKFDEMWEWDEDSKGKYDGNDWDFIDLGNAGTVSNIWIDHCTFTKAYDGETDIKQGSFGITFSWCKYMGDDGAANTNSWVRQQINYLEQSPSSYPMYNFLRTHGFSVEDIVTIIQGHDKTHLIGANDKDPQNAQHTVTFHHDWFMNPWDRLPRLRAGNVHNYNIYVDDTLGLAAKRLRDARANAMTTANRNTLNNTYSFNPFLNGSISTENGAVLVEKSVYIDCITPLRNNQTDPSDPTYTGKIKALDTIYQFDSTVVRGNSTDSGNPLGPFQAAIIPFSWNLPGNQLPYSYNMDDPSQLQTIVTSPTAGAGAGVLTWAKTNWLMTSYAPTAPIIVSDPQSQNVTTNQSATFIIVAGGSLPLRYQWYFNTNTPIANATNTSLRLANIQAADAGTYSVIVTNVAGAATSTNATLTVINPAPPKFSNGGITHLGNGSIQFSISGTAGQSYRLWASTNIALSPITNLWTLLTNDAFGNGPTIYTDSQATNFPKRFYIITVP
jgi:pectate lyase